MRAPGKGQENLEEEWLSEEDEIEENDEIWVEWRITPFAFSLHKAVPKTTTTTHNKQRKNGVWAKRLEELQAFRRTHGHCDVPKRPAGLGAWLSYVRRRRRQGSLGADQIRQLDELGVCWGGSPIQRESGGPTSTRKSPAVTLVDSHAATHAPTRPGDHQLLTNPGGMEQEDGGGGGGGEVVEIEECDRCEGEEEEEEGGEGGEEKTGEGEGGAARGRSARMDENLFAGRVYQLRKFRRKHGHFRLGRSELGKWLARMKRYQHVGLLTADKEEILRAVGVTFEGDKQTPKRQYFEADQEWEVEAILDKRMYAVDEHAETSEQQPLYKVKWKDYEETTWEPLSNLIGCDLLLTQFEAERTKAEQQQAAVAPYCDEARRIAVYSNFPEADCTVALRLSNGCRDLALLWLHTDPRERTWLESRVFKFSSAEAQNELGIVLDPTPIVRHSYSTRLASAAASAVRPKRQSKSETAKAAARPVRPSRAKRKSYKYDDDDEEEEEEEEDYGRSEDEDELDGLSGAENDEEEEEVQLTTRRSRRAKKTKKTKVQSDGMDEEDVRDESDEEDEYKVDRDIERRGRAKRTSQSTTSREQRKALRDRKMAEEWESRRQQHRVKSRRTLATLAAQQQELSERQSRHHQDPHKQPQQQPPQAPNHGRDHDAWRANGSDVHPAGLSYDEEAIERRLAEYATVCAAMPQWSAASDQGFGGAEAIPGFSRPGEALPDHQPQWPAQWQWPIAEEAHRGNGGEAAMNATTTWVDVGYHAPEEPHGPGVEDEEERMKEREEVELEGLYVITPQKRNEGGDEQRPAAHTALAGEQREKAECGHQQSDLSGGVPATVEELLMVDPLLIGMDF